MSWRSFAPDSSEIIRQILPVSLDSSWVARPLHNSFFDSYSFFLFASTHHIATDDFEVTAQLSPSDASAFAALQTHFAAIQQEVIAGVVQAENAPTPPPPHPDSKRFYRLERSFPDSDGDGLTDYQEFLSQQNNPNGEGSDPFVDNGESPDDFDGDGIPNDVEEE